MGDTELTAAISGLIHDVGKFALRAGVGASRLWDATARQDYGHKHALLSEDYAYRYVPEAIRARVKAVVGNYHRPTTRLDFALALADRLSSGERDPETGDDRDVQPKQLLPIFCSLQADGARAPADVYLPLKELTIDQATLFPQAPLASEAVWKQYERLWKDFTTEADKLQQSFAGEAALELYLEALLPLWQRFTWSMPAAYYKNRPDISLYDHGRVTGALAAIFVSGAWSDAELQRFSQKPEAVQDELAILIGADLTGVQEFIYTITARGATSALRGRSFYLQLLNMAAARYILRRLDLPITNLIYTGGGNFYLLARPGDATRLEEIQRELSRILLDSHRGDLYLALASVPLRGMDFGLGKSEGKISRRWGELTEKLNRAKLRKYSELGSDLYDQVFRAQGDGGNEDKQCQVCGIEHGETREIDAGEGREVVRKCPFCQSYESLGDDLRKANYLLIAPTAGAPAGGTDGWEKTLRQLGVRAAVLERLQGNEQGVLYALNDEAYRKLEPRLGLAPARQFLVNVTPVIQSEEIAFLRQRGVDDLPVAERIKPFHAMEAQSEGVGRLGVLRMDVDNLGRLFAEGLEKEKSTLSRVASLSLAISLFFEGWVGRIAEEMNRADAQRGKEYGERLYSIYSGGDDLFFVGAWDAVIELARRIRADLTDYAAGHPGIHASAGVVLIGGKQPLSQAAEWADVMEKQAKGYHRGEKEHEKDAITFLGQTLGWEKFGLQDCTEHHHDTAHAMMHHLDSLIAHKSELKPLLRRLIRLQERYGDATRERREKGTDLNQNRGEQALFGPWNWLSEYTLARMAEKDKPNRADFDQLRQRLKKDDFRSIEWIGLAARWAELLRRN